MKIKKIIILIVILAIISCLLIGCKNDNELKKYEDMLKNNKDPITLSLWVYYNNVQEKAFDAIINEFNSTIGRDNRIVIEPQYLSSVGMLATKVKESAGKKVGAGPMPEMFMTYSDDCLSLDNEYNIVASLDKYFTQDEKDGYIQGFLSEGYYNGKDLKIVPVAKSTEIMMINKTDWDIFANKYNLENPSNQISLNDLNTWEGLSEVASIYHKETGKALFGFDSTANFMFVNSLALGSEIVSNGKVSDNKSVYKKLFDSIFAPHVRGEYANEGRFRTNGIGEGSLLGCVGSSTMGSYFPNEIKTNPGEQYTIESYAATIPTYKGSGKNVIQQGAGIAVSKTTELKEYASTVFLKWFNQKENSMQFVSSSGYLPSTKEALNENLILSSIEGQGKNVKNAFTAALKTVDEYTFYYSKPYNNSNKVRNILDNCIYNKDEAKPNYMTDFINVTNILKEISLSPNKAQLINYYTSEEFFNIWSENLQQLLKKAIEGSI